MANMYAKFDEEAHSGLVSIVFTILFPSVSAKFIGPSDRQDKYVIGPISLISSRTEMSNVASSTMYTMYTQSQTDICSVLWNASPNRTECPMTFRKVSRTLSIYVNCDLDLWPVTSKINRVHPLIIVNMSAKFDEKAHNGSVFYRVHKLISIYVNSDLDLWPLTSKINRVHSLVIVNMSAKFDEEAHNGSLFIVFTSLFPYMSIVTLTFDLWPPKSIGFILSS